MCVSAGATKSGGGGLATSALSQSGEKIDLTDYPLKYGDADKALTPNQRRTIEDFEQRHQKSKVEYATLLDADGNPTMPEKRGGKNGVRTYASDWRNAEVMSHNHPRSENGGILGGTFSYDDLNTFTTVKTKTMRAAAAEGTYSITKSGNFNYTGFRDYARNIRDRNYSGYKAAELDLRKQYKTSKITYDDYVKQSNKAFNKMLVDMHNELLSGQKTYGYTYTLERRK